ncbi:hypothetical protein DPEC_G00220730 [Dallia pectoralis]|uniref:Uncharacterized protein n=1 Tax=Dallia pectoralis TaxID=75939 RepID=A0ACC2G442_DALPE|nr:hypothetical protein DPEC_G00220730 [Dallia pectoralis]
MSTKKELIWKVFLRLCCLSRNRNLEDSQKGQHAVIMRQAVNETPQPRDHIIWSLCSLVYGNLCCGILAVYYSIKSRDRKVLGDLEGARAHGKTARCFNIVTLTVTLIVVFIVIIVYSVMIPQIMQMKNEHPTFRDRELVEAPGLCSYTKYVIPVS